MTALPTTHTFSAGEVVTDTTMNNNITAVLNFVMAPPICQAYQTVAQSLANNTDVALTFDTETVDSSGMHSTASNTDRFTAVYPGWYDTGGVVSYASNATGNRASKISVNGVNQNIIDNRPASVAATISQPTGGLLYFLNVGDILRSLANQNSGGALNTGAGTINPTFKAVWVSS